MIHSPIINDKHFFLESGPDMRDLTKPLLSLDITYFGYSRYYNDGGRLWLSNSPENIKNYYDTKSYQIGNTEAHPSSYKPQVVLWSTLPNQRVFEGSKALGIDHGIFIIQPQKESCEIFAFGTRSHNPGIINTYLTHMDFLKNFNLYFKQTAENLIKTGEKNKIYLPYHNNPLPDYGDNLPDLNQSAKLKLSSRQLSCITHLVEGYTIREIADLQNLSPRTVESYINNVKYKLHCRNKAELIAKFLKLISNGREST